MKNIALPFVFVLIFAPCFYCGISYSQKPISRGVSEVKYESEGFDTADIKEQRATDRFFAQIAQKQIVKLNAIKSRVLKTRYTAGANDFLFLFFAALYLGLLNFIAPQTAKTQMGLYFAGVNTPYSTPIMLGLYTSVFYTAMPIVLHIALSSVEKNPAQATMLSGNMLAGVSSIVFAIIGVLLFLNRAVRLLVKKYDTEIYAPESSVYVCIAAGLAPSVLIANILDFSSTAGFAATAAVLAGFWAGSAAGFILWPLLVSLLKKTIISVFAGSSDGNCAFNNAFEMSAFFLLSLASVWIAVINFMNV